MKKLFLLAILAAAPQFAFAATCSIPAGATSVSLYSSCTFVVPTYTSLTASVNGGGGGGGGSLTGYKATGGGGGGGGGYSSKTYSAGQLTVGSPVTVTVGTGGAGGTGSLYMSTMGSPGTASSFAGGPVGNGGGQGYQSGTGGGTGGTASGGTTNTAGGNGTNGGLDSGGAGGSSANGSGYGTGGSGGRGGSGYAGRGGQVVISWTPPPPTCTLSPSSQTIGAGSSASLTYTISGSATSASVNGTAVSPSSSGTYTDTPAQTTNYTMTASNSGGSNTCGPATVTVLPLLQCNGSTQTLSTPGTYTYSVPTYASMVVEAWGGGGSGASGNQAAPHAGYPGNNSSFVYPGGSVVGDGGPAAVQMGGVSGGGFVGDIPPSANGGNGGAPNQYTGISGNGGAGGGPGGGAGGAGYGTGGGSPAGHQPGGGGGGGAGATYQLNGGGQVIWPYALGGGGGGGYGERIFTPSTLAPGTQVTITVGTGAAPNIGSQYPGGAGANGQVSVTCSAGQVDRAPRVPTLTTAPSAPVAGTNYQYGFTATDPDAGDTVAYAIDWTMSGVPQEYIPVTYNSATFSPTLASGTEGQTTHAFNKSGPATFEAEAIDNHGSNSGWQQYSITVSAAPPTVLLTSSLDNNTPPRTYSQGSGPVTLTWSSSPDATSCAASASPAASDWNGPKAFAGTFSAQVTPTQQTTYSISCSGPGGQSNPSSVTISYQCAIRNYCSGNTSHHVDTICTDTPTDCTALNQTCSTSQGLCVAPPPPSVVPSGGNSGYLQAKPSLVPGGKTSRLFWNIANVATCFISGNGWSSQSASCDQNTNICTSGLSGLPTLAIKQQTTFSLRCTGLDNSSTSSSATVNVVPVFREY